MNKPKNGKYDILAENFWNNVTTVMKERGVTWNELAEKLGVSPKTLFSRRSAKSNVSIGSAVEIAEAIGTDVDRLIYGVPKTN